MRKLKSEKAEADKITAEVGKLLVLKRELSLAQGIDPDQAAAGGKKSKKKKKWDKHNARMSFMCEGPPFPLR